MKKKRLSLFTLLLSGLLLASCGGGNTPSSGSSASGNPSSESSQSSEASRSSETSEAKPSESSESKQSSESKPSESSESKPVESSESVPGGESSAAESSQESSEAEWIDYAHNGSVILNLDYKGRDFFQDGVEEVSLYNTIDGDTAHFKTKSKGEVLKARFFGIDTPESTGKIQAYGHAASEYTSGLLEKAGKNGTIVVSSAQQEYGEPNPDSTGSRYVSLVWINPDKKNADVDELYLLNLMIVQEGLSWVKNVRDMPQYQDAFLLAERQAKAFKLNLHSGEPDPWMPVGDYEYVSLLELKRAYIEEIEAHAAGDTEFVNRYHNKKIRVQGTVNGFSNHIVYLADFCFYTDEDGNPIDDSHIEIGVTGEYASINVFVGMSNPPTKFTTLGNYIDVAGKSMDSKFGFQITDVDMPVASYGTDSESKVILKAAANTEEHALHVFDYTASELQTAVDSDDYNALNCRINVNTPMTVSRGYKDDSGNITLYFQGYTFRVYFVFKFKPYPVEDPAVTWTEVDDFKGHSFTVTGVYAHYESSTGNTSMQIYPSTSADLVLVS